MKGNTGINSLAKILSERMKAENKTPPMCDFGVIHQDYSLSTNTFPVKIPKTDYSICRSLTIGEQNSELITTQEEKNNAHTHIVPVPEKMRSILPGDRVLVIWVADTPVVVDIIVSAGAL